MNNKIDENIIAISSNEETIKKRQVSIELLRIIAMIMIVFHHFAIHSEAIFDTGLNIPKLWYNLINIGGKIGVNIFILISGYFLVDNNDLKINFKKLLKFWSQIIFYSISIFILFALILGPKIVSFNNIVPSFFPITFSNWWFASAYFVLYLLHPYINKFLKSLNKSNFQLFLIITTIIWSVIPTFTTSKFQSNNLIWFFYLYSISSYIKIYGLNQKFKTKHYIIVFLLLFILTYSSTIVFAILGTKWDIFNKHSTYFFGIEKINILFCSICLFMIFSLIKIRYIKFINYVASCTFAIYLIHDHAFIRNFLWIDLFKNAEHFSSTSIIPYSIAVVILVFVGCLFIEIIRKILFDKIIFKFISFIFSIMCKLASPIINILQTFIFGK